MKIEIAWRKQERQLTFLRACGLSHPFEGGKPTNPVAKVIGYGGSAGGGKSDALLMAGIIFALSFPGSNVGFFRRKFTQLEGPGGAIMRSAELIPPSLASYNQQKKRWTFINGSILQFCHLEHETTVYDYQSQQFDLICFDEATHFTRSQYSYMKTRNRSTTSNVIRPIMLLATNPGNIGHAWFKEEFVDIGEPEQPHEVEVEEGKEVHLFIPAFLSDNRALEERDPEYRKQLENQPENVRRQLLEGDWDVAEGVAFTEWNKKYHVCEPFQLPDSWIKFRSYDHGYVKPYAVGWYAIDHDGRLYKYRELYPEQPKGIGDKGSQETPAEIAEKIIRLEAEDKNLQYAVADDAIFGGKQDNSPSIAEQFAEAFGSNAKHFTPVGKGPRSRIQGKLELHHRLRIPKDEQGNVTSKPMLVFFNTCKHTIRTLPTLTLDEKNPEDIDTTLEDHLYDELRYACMSRPMASPLPKPKETRIQKHKKRISSQLKQQQRRLI